MYIKRITGPRAITLPDGTSMTLADLPPPDTKRWVASRKAAVLRALASGLITRAQALETYALSDEELDGWTRAVCQHGPRALKVTKLRRYRQP